MEPHAGHVLHLWQRVSEQELHERRPVDALVPPPVASTRAFVVFKVWVTDGGELLEHLARFAHRDVVISVAMQDVDTLLQVVLLDAQRVARASGAEQHLRSRIFCATACVRRRAARGRGSYVTSKADPSCTRGDGSKFTREMRTQLPCSVAPHRMTSEPTAARIIHERRACVRHCFREINASPVFPVETERTAIGWAHNVCFLLRRIRSSLAGCFNARPVHTEENARLCITTSIGSADRVGWHHGRRRNDCVVLSTAIDRAHARHHAAIARSDGGKFNRQGAQHGAVARCECHLYGVLAACCASKLRRKSRRQSHLFHSERRHDMEFNPFVTVGEVAVNMDARAGEWLRGCIDHCNADRPIGVALGNK